MNQDCLRVIVDWGGGYEEDECEALEKVGKGHGGRRWMDRGRGAWVGVKERGAEQRRAATLHPTFGRGDGHAATRLFWVMGAD